MKQNPRSNRPSSWFAFTLVQLLGVLGFQGSCLSCINTYTVRIGAQSTDNYAGWVDSNTNSLAPATASSPVGDFFDIRDIKTGFFKATGLANLPAGATITGAKLRMFVADTQGNTRTLTIYRLLRNWTAAATWSKYNGTAAWSSGGGQGSGTDRASVSSGSVVVNGASASGQLIEISSAQLLNDVQKMFSGAVPNYGWVIVNPLPGVLSLRGSATGTNLQRPELEVTYTLATVPAQSSAAGFSKLTFEARNFSAANVDIGKTYAPGFKFYAFDLFGENPNMGKISFSNGDMILAGQGFNDLIGYTTVAHGSLGKKFSGGFYAEFEMACSKAQVNAQNDPTHWPACWFLPANRPEMGGNPQWAGAPAGYVHYMEIDTAEVFPNQASDTYGGALHDQFGQGGVTTQLHILPSGDRRVSTSAVFDLNTFHRYGTLWIPATSTTPGRMEYYFDGVRVGQSASWPLWTNPAPPLTDASAQKFSYVDKLEYFMILNAGPNQEMRVRSVRVWQK